MTTLAIVPDKSTAMRDFAKRWTQAQPAVSAFIWSLVPHRADAEDLLQRTAESLVVGYHRYDRAQPFTAWAIGVARIEVLRFRQERRRDRLVFDDETISAVTAAAELHAAEISELRAALRGCLEQLTGRLKEVLSLHYLSGSEPSEIAGQLGISENAVFVALHRARASLRKCMEQRWLEEGEGYGQA